MAESLDPRFAWLGPVLTLALAHPVAATVAADAVLGRWQGADAPDAVVEIRAQGLNLYQGRIVAHAREADAIGAHVIRDLRYDADRARWCGARCASRHDRERDVEIVRDADGRFSLLVSTWSGQRRVRWSRVP
ncbi:MAG TPA: hypothetical protein VGE57_07785 [Solimonas sp.]